MGSAHCIVGVWIPDPFKDPEIREEPYFFTSEHLLWLRLSNASLPGTVSSML